MNSTMNGWIEMELGDMGRSVFNDQPLTDDKRQLKESSIATALSLKDLDILKTLAKSREGLMKDNIRKEIWPLFLGMKSFTEEPQVISAINNEILDVNKEKKHEINNSKTESKGLDTDGNYKNKTTYKLFKNELDSYKGVDWKSLSPHKDEAQVRLDVDRAFVFYPKEHAEQIMKRKEQLYNTIVQVLRRNPKLSYYQGYHDICQVLLLVFGVDEAAIDIIEHVTLFFLRDFMLPNISSSIDHLKLIPPLLFQVDSELADILNDIQPFYALSSILTLFCHDIHSFPDICIIFDFIFSTKTMVAPIYLYVSIILQRKKEIIDLQTSDSDIIHSFLSNLPNPLSSLTVFDAINRASKLLTQYPVSLLKEWTEISDYSVLKTTAIPPFSWSLRALDERLYDSQTVAGDESFYELSDKYVLSPEGYSSPEYNESATTSAATLSSDLTIYSRDVIDQIFEKHITEALEKARLEEEKRKLEREEAARRLEARLEARRLEKKKLQAQSQQKSMFAYVILLANNFVNSSSSGDKPDKKRTLIYLSHAGKLAVTVGVIGILVGIYLRSNYSSQSYYKLFQEINRDGRAFGSSALNSLGINATKIDQYGWSMVYGVKNWYNTIRG